jgi:hypothetical protein
MVLHSYHALNEDANAKQAMYWSPDGFQLIVADVGRLVASECRLDYRLLRLHFSSPNSLRRMFYPITTNTASLLRSVGS